MTDTDTLLDLLDRWEEKYLSGEDLSPKDLCPDRPEWHELLGQRITRRKHLLSMLETPRPPGSTPEDHPVFTDYEVTGVLGRGGMGIVYEAMQLRLNRLVAIKMINLAVPDQSSLTRFETEAQTLARIAHPHIVQIHEVGSQSGRPYLVLEKLEDNLARRLREAPLPPRDAAKLIETLARAVQHAHDHGILHRDLKPANVLFTTDGIPKIADFGLAKHVTGAGDGPTHTGAVLGTPSYMAPEQARGASNQIGPAVDIYALGAMLYECLVGRPPFKGADMMETLAQVVEQDPVSIRQLQPKTPRDLETICQKCLRKQPKNRYSSARELAEDLGRFLDGQPVRARPLSPAARGWRWAKRHPTTASVSLALILAIITVLTVGGIYSARLAASREQERQLRTKAEDALEVAKGAASDLGDMAYLQLTKGDQTRLPKETVKQLNTAISAYERLFEIEDTDADVADRLGHLLFLLNRHDALDSTFERAAKAFRRAMFLREQHYRESPNDADRKRTLAQTCHRWGDLLNAHGDGDEAIPVLTRAIQLRQELVEEFPDDPDAKAELALTQILMGKHYYYLRQDWARALEFFNPALETLAEDLKRETPHPESYVRYIDNVANQARALTRTNRLEEALVCWDRVLQDKSLYPRLKKIYLTDRAITLAKLGRYSEAEQEISWSNTLRGLDAKLLTSALTVHALNLVHVKADEELSPSERDEWVEQLHERAKAKLILAQQAGVFNRKRYRSWLITSENLDGLNEIPEFAQLQESLTRDEE